MYPAIAESFVTPDLHNVDLLNDLSEREGRKILSATDALKAKFMSDEISALIGIYNEHSDVIINFEDKVKEAKN